MGNKAFGCVGFPQQILLRLKINLVNQEFEESCDRARLRIFKALGLLDCGISLELELKIPVASSYCKLLIPNPVSIWD